MQGDLALDAHFSRGGLDLEGLQACAVRIRQRALAAAWGCWRYHTAGSAALRLRVKALMARLVHRHLFAVWEVWSAYAVIRAHRRRVLAQVASHLQHQVSKHTQSQDAAGVIVLATAASGMTTARMHLFYPGLYIASIVGAIPNR